MEAGRVTVVGTASDLKLFETAVTLRALLVALPRLVPAAFGPTPPLVVAVAHDPAHLARVGAAPGRAAAGRIVLATTGDEEARADLLRAATTALAGRSAAPLPAWLVVGLSEYSSTFTATMTRATLGRLVLEHVRRLASRRPVGARPALFSIPSLGSDAPDGDLLRAEAWAVVHFLLHAAPDGEERLGRYVELLAKGSDAAAAFREAFGESEKALLDRACEHAAGARSLARYVPVPSSAPPPGRILPLTRAGAAGVLGGIARGRAAIQPDAPEGREAAIAPSPSASPPVLPSRPPASVSRNVPAEVDLVNRLIDEGREEEALARLEALHASLGGDPEMQRALGWDVAEVRRVVVHNRLVRRYNEAIALLNAGRREDAVPIFREVAAAAEDPELRRLAWERATAPDPRRR